MEDDYKKRDQLEFSSLYPSDVREEDWGFADKLNGLKERWKYLRRVLFQVQCANPATGKLDVRLSELIDENSRYADSEEAHAARAVVEEFVEESSEFNVYLCDALSVLSPATYRIWIDDCAEWVDEDQLVALSARAEAAELAGTKQTWMRYYLFMWHLDFAYGVLAKWEEKLWQLRLGDTLAVWRYLGSAQGAREGGLKSGETRAKAVAITAEAAMKLRDELLSQGRSERSVARIIAQRHSVSPDHIRRLIRPAKNRPEGG